MKRILVSGGAGFIGSHLVRRLLADPAVERIVVYDNFSSGKRDHLACSGDDARLSVVGGDLKDGGAVVAAMAGADTVFHLAANPDIAKAATQPDIDFYEGTLLTQNVLEAMRLNKVGKIFYTSGSGVYGEDARRVFGEHDGPFTPISTYAASKLASESLIAAYCHMFGMVGLVVRLANVVGPRQTHGVGYDFIRRLGRDLHYLRILGDGRQRKSYIHVDDALDALFLLDRRTNSRFDVFNVATGDDLTVREIADLAVEVLGFDPASVRYELTGGDRGWKGDVPVIHFDLKKIHALGWKAKRGSRAAMRDALAAMKAEVLGAGR
jgi:UDP-glucose 4-epimerase